MDGKGYIFFTGATGGLGTACVRLLSRQGYTVFAAGTNREKLAALSELPHVTPVCCDITSAESVREARAFVGGRTDRLYAVVNFAGLTGFCPMVEGDAPDTVQRLLDVNVMGMVRVNREFFGMVRAGGGRILNCSSEAGWMKAQPFAAPYYLSKHAVEAYSDSLRRELAYFRIPVIKIQPGSFKTGMLENVSTQFDKTLAATAYYGRLLTRMKPMMTRELTNGGDPERLAEVVLRAVEAKRPKIRYRVGTSRQLAVLNLLPDALIDTVYKALFSR